MILVALSVNTLINTKPISIKQSVSKNKNMLYRNNRNLTFKNKTYQLSSKIIKNIFQRNYKNESFWKILLENYKFKPNNNLYLFLISLGVENCPNSEYLWIKYIENLSYNLYKFNILKSVKLLPTNYKIWKLIIDKCSDEKEKQKLLLKSLKNIPYNNTLWRLFIKHINVQLYPIVLHKAIGCCPNDLELWRLLISTKNYFESKKILNAARKLNPEKVEIWILAACLEEAYGYNKNSYKLIKKCFLYYHNKDKIIDLKLFKHIILIEKTQTKPFKIFKIIIKLIILKNINDELFLEKWINAIYSLNPKNNPFIVEEMIKNACIVFPNNYTLIFYLFSHFINNNKIKKFENALEIYLTKNLNLELLWIIAFSYFYKKFEYINISLLFKKFYIRKYHINCITIYLTNIYKYREIIKFFTVFRILTFYYPAIKIFTRIKKNYVNFIINNFAELHFDIDVNEVLIYIIEYFFLF
ncbi:mRNA splicing factor PRP6 (nucleomorph) [Lotharella oceanica]|uniref:mRNA splicing factor PRP6 n=1 Tax=Lotharella oceanica TaxID=641309 RepID=A0A060DAP2_9EUKA|nr:mRNA splicing factor PRP6 [Lotharella oceanica]